MFHRVLVPLDSTKLSDKVLSAAFRCTDPHGEILVLRIQSDPIDLEDFAKCRAELDAVEKETQATLRRINDAGGDVHTATVRAEVRSGPLAGTILDTAEEAEVDLIVMGTHGRKGLTDHLLGSVTEQVASKASASVFVVKAAGYPFLQD